MKYVELHTHSYYSLLDGASSPEALLARAKELSMPALALTDHDNLYGAVRFWQAAREWDIQPIIGAEVTLAPQEGEADPHSSRHIVLLAETQTGYANLCRLLTRAHLGMSDKPPHEVEPWPGKQAPMVDWETLNAHRKGLIALTGCRAGVVAAPLLRDDFGTALAKAERLLHIFGRRHLFVELQRHLLPDEPPLLRRLVDIAWKLDLETVVTNNVHYARRQEHRLQDVMVCIRHLTSLDEAEDLLRPNSEFYLKAGEEMARLFPGLERALENTVRIAERCEVSLDFSQKRLPSFPLPQGHTAFSYLYELCQEGLRRKYRPVTPAASKQLAYELEVIEKTGLAGYFLIVWDIVRFAQKQGIRYQGRGSAANSLVAYLLDITPVDPLRFNLLFDRFLSPDSHTMPDIDVDFAADRRDEVIQYVYRRYGYEHTAMVCNINTFRLRSALRDVGRALGLHPEMIEQIRRQYWEQRGRDEPDLERPLSKDQEVAGEQGAPHRLLLELCEQLQGAPRHLSIHVGGMLITADPLTSIVPLERATMPGRIVAQWDKDSVEDAGLIKIDLLGLRTLGMVDEIVKLIENRGQKAPDLEKLPLDDGKVYEALDQADTMGVFQVESRAQMQMLPRLRPRCFDDLVVEVAIIRPGPIQGNMVHPYLRRRQGLEPVTYPHPSLEPVLQETLGVVLFQEQVLRVAMAVAGFSGGQADRLRRTMSRQRSREEMNRLREVFVQGAVTRGVDEETARVIFAQLEGFATYGFCKSHAAAFALLAYQTMWLKLYHPLEFYCALLNHQPMGFYAPAVIVGDARRHGIAVQPPDLNLSQENCTIEQNSIRLGLRYVKGVGPAARQRLLALRASQPYADLRDLCYRTRLPRDVIQNLIRGGALDSIDSNRRRLLWQLKSLQYTPDTLPVDSTPEPIPLPPLTEAETIAWHIELLSLHPGEHLLHLYREHLSAAGIQPAARLKHHRDGAIIQVAGQVVVRQKPPTAKGHLFLTLEDETGLVNLIVRPHLYEQKREILRHAPFLHAVGRLQKEGEAFSILVFSIEPLELPPLTP